MYNQTHAPGWTQAIRYLPDYVSIKDHDPGGLTEAMDIWRGLGRDPARLWTVHRHFDSPTYDGKGEPLAAYMSHARKVIGRWCDKTFLERHAANVRIVGGPNEFIAESTWKSARDSDWALKNMEAFARVWNEEYRGKEIETADGGQGRIPADLRMSIMAGTVSHKWPVDVFDLSIGYDAPLDYHAYLKCWHGVRWPDDWANHSGLWNTLEEKYNRRPNWLFGESGPYFDSAGGWLRHDVLNGNVSRLGDLMLAWWGDCATTAAYKDGRLLGAGCWFVLGNVGWPYYELAPVAPFLAKLLRPMWRPAPPRGPRPIDPEDSDMPLTDDQRRRLNEAKMHVAKADELLGGLVAETALHDLRDKSNQFVINLFNSVLGGYDELGRAIPNWAQTMAANSTTRAALYTGPAIENMANLTDTERARLIAAL